MMGLTLLFEEEYGYGLIVYLWLGLLVMLSISDLRGEKGFLGDHATDYELRTSDRPKVIAEWRELYENSMRPEPLNFL